MEMMRAGVVDFLLQAWKFSRWIRLVALRAYGVAAGLQFGAVRVVAVGTGDTVFMHFALQE